ncbi:MAG: Sensory transduction protein regX3 [Chloroflexi bacterium ADurb.Bin180]|nr:MAG: Sensory transduction protein regX3 [Chloroflexi bacterium ADurb.Bin180]
MAQNPFYHRGPVRDPDYFFGREAETEQVAHLLLVSQSVSIVGPRRIGKTSFLYHLLSEPVRSSFGLTAPGHILALLSAEGLAAATVSEVYAAFLETLAEALPAAERPPAATPDYHGLDQTLKTLCARGCRLALLIDEFEALAGNPALDPSFFSGLRGLATRYTLSFVVASQRPLISLAFADRSVLSSPFFNIFATVPLGLFTAEQSRAMTTALLERGAAALPEAALGAVAALAGPHPFFAQLAAYHALEMARTLSVWDESATARLAERFAQEAGPHLQYAWHNLSDDERYTLANLHIDQRDPGARETLRQLEEQCLILPTPAGWAYLSATLRRFVRCQEVRGLLQAGGPFVIDLNRRLATAEGIEFALTRTQFDLLAFLARRGGRVATNRELEESIWHDQYVDDPERIKAAIKHLRRALGPYGACIVNQRGIGYALRPRTECEP